MLALIILATRAFYILSSVAILTVRLIPAFSDRFLAYGAREQAGIQGKPKNKEQRTMGIQILDNAAILKVPHSWFTHFYIVSVACSLGFAYIFHNGNSLQKYSVPALCSIMMFIQGCRRLLECVFLTKPSTARMWIGHYTIGLIFYVATNLAIWIEHLEPTSAIKISESNRDHLLELFLNPGVLVCTFTFIYAAYQQHRYHRYLASLRKYTLPDDPAFQLIIAPHYTTECVIYLSLAVLDAPQKHERVEFINWTLFCALVFVIVNLGITADGTKAWMMAKFPERKEEIRKRWRVIPLLW
ncbi:uncharacterized protein Z518_07978 [Rhinocladiella mackenziei CBS 650.93]|uniref:Polyprenal reductase n=1 Tax=Rhinocladiella mackenziei CBS 650.93 TaxID=1442369 RepID=A0A0D2I876_9EURO|nr:uncharacterized protein Z518_07978 [Rhinocladiella mackenziei CBS 650.93]KIX02039.1 hypothetical protein Z518_07978 [Rhinocladiella mackenziei CBS 650.93]